MRADSGEAGTIEKMNCESVRFWNHLTGDAGEQLSSDGFLNQISSC